MVPLLCEGSAKVSQLRAWRHGDISVASTGPLEHGCMGGGEMLPKEAVGTGLQEAVRLCVFGCVSYHLWQWDDQQPGGLGNSHMVMVAGWRMSHLVHMIVSGPQRCLCPHLTEDNISSTQGFLKKWTPDMNGLQKSKFLFSLKWVWNWSALLRCRQMPLSAQSSSYWYWKRDKCLQLIDFDLQLKATPFEPWGPWANYRTLQVLISLFFKMGQHYIHPGVAGKVYEMVYGKCMAWFMQRYSVSTSDDDEGGRC